MLLRPGVDALVVMIDEVKLACGVDGRTGDGEEAVFELVHCCPGSDDGRGIGRRGWLRIGRDVQDRELALADFEMMRDIFNRIFVGKLTEAQEGAATVVVADAVTALGIDVNVAEMNVG